MLAAAQVTPKRSLTKDLIIRGKYHDGISLSIRIEKWQMFNTLRSHSGLSESRKSGGLAVECQKARLMQLSLTPASTQWLGSLQTGELATSGVPGAELRLVRNQRFLLGFVQLNPWQFSRLIANSLV